MAAVHFLILASLCAPCMASPDQSAAAAAPGAGRRICGAKTTYIGGLCQISCSANQDMSFQHLERCECNEELDAIVTVSSHRADQVSNMTETISTLKNENEQLGDQVSNMNETISTMTETISTLKNETEQLGNQVSTMTETISTLNNQPGPMSCAEFAYRLYTSNHLDFQRVVLYDACEIYCSYVRAYPASSFCTCIRDQNCPEP